MQADSFLLNLPKVELTNRENLPKVSGIYYVIDETGLVWYIGQAQDIYCRWKGKIHHRLFQLASQKKKKFCIYYRQVERNQLYVIEQEAILKYSPYLNQSPVKTKQIRPTETLLRETLIKLADYLIIIGIEPPRRLNQDLCSKCKTPQETWYIQKTVLNLSTIHLGIDIDKVSQIIDNQEALSGVLSSGLTSRKAYANQWQQPPGCRKNQLIKIYESARLLVNGYNVEITAIYGMSRLNYKTDKLSLASEMLTVLSEESLKELKLKGIKMSVGLFINNKEHSERIKNQVGYLILSRIQSYQEDPISLVFKETLNIVDLSKHIEKVQEAYKNGLRGFGSRSKI